MCDAAARVGLGHFGRIFEPQKGHAAVSRVSPGGGAGSGVWCCVKFVAWRCPAIWSGSIAGAVRLEPGHHDPGNDPNTARPRWRRVARVDQRQDWQHLQAARRYPGPRGRVAAAGSSRASWNTSSAGASPTGQQWSLSPTALGSRSLSWRRRRARSPRREKWANKGPRTDHRTAKQGPRERG